MMNGTKTHAHLPAGTRVWGTVDGEPGTIMNPFSLDPDEGWYEYEVQTRCGVERWLRWDFVLMSELEDNA
jgi:hypothetical protein